MIYMCPYFKNIKVTCSVLLPIWRMVVPYRLNFRSKLKNFKCATEGCYIRNGKHIPTEYNAK